MSRIEEISVTVLLSALYVAEVIGTLTAPGAVNEPLDGMMIV